MICPMCGMVLPDGAKFCFECGEKVVDVPAAKKLEEPLESPAMPAAPMVPATPPRATPYYPRSTSRSRAARANRSVPDFDVSTVAPAPSATGGAAATSSTSGSASGSGSATAGSEAGAGAEAGATGILSRSAAGMSAAGRPSSAARSGRSSSSPARRASGTVPTEADPFSYNPETDTTFDQDSDAASDRVPADGFSSRFTTIPATGNGQEAFRLSQDRRPSVGSRIVVGLVAVVVAVAIVGLLGYATFGWFGPSTWFSSEDEDETTESDEATTDDSADEDAATVVVAPDVQEAVEDYSWEDLSYIADLIAAAEDDEAGLEIAIEYNLCNEDGMLDGTQTKTFELEDGTEVTVRIVGFRADTRSDGTGLAGITFLATTSVGEVAMNSDDSVEGGWGASELREWMNSELVELLPDELTEVVVAVDKVTSLEAGVASSEQETTSDTLWVPSYSEVAGEPSSSSRAAAYVEEGAQYQLFAEAEEAGTLSEALVATIGADAWWLRSPDCLDEIRFQVVYSDGSLSWSFRPVNQLSVVMGFCL